MVTERKTILNRTVLSENIQKKNLHKLFIISLVCLIVGALGVVAYIALGVALETESGDTPAWCEAFLVFAVPFAFGLVFILTINSLVKQARKNNGVINEYEFFADCIMAREIRGGEICANVRLNYDQVLKTKQAGEYLFFFYQIKSYAYPIDTTELTPPELNTVKKLLGAKTDEGCEILELASSADVAEKGIEESAAAAKTGKTDESAAAAKTGKTDESAKGAASGAEKVAAAAEERKETDGETADGKENSQDEIS